MIGMDGEKKIWVGQFRTGNIVVFDSRCQRRAYSGSVILWEASSTTFDCYVAKTVKPDLETVAVSSVRNETLDQYRAFVRRLVESNHRVLFEEYELTYEGTRPARRNPQADASCFLCKSALDSWIDLACSKCGWTLCGCGACGCFFRRPEPAWAKRRFNERTTLDEYAWKEAYHRWLALPPRSTDPEEICALLRVVPVKVAHGFCGMCDSQVSNEWCLQGPDGAVSDLSHCAQNPGDVLRRSEYDLLVEALEHSNVKGTLLGTRQSVVDKFLGLFSKEK